MIPHRSLCRGVALVAVLGGCARSGPSRTAREQEVYAAYLDSVAALGMRRIVLRSVHADPRPWLLVDGGQSLPDSTQARLALARAGVPAALARDFVAATLRPDSMRQLPLARVRIDFDTLPPFTEAARDSIRRSGQFEAGFDRIVRAYPGATVVIGLSHVGFSPDGRGALLYEESYCGLLCGGGVLTRLRWEGGRWRLAERVTLWAT